MVEFNKFQLSVSELTAFDCPVKISFAAGKRFRKLHEIASSCLTIPVSTVAAERSFSLYNEVLRNDRRSNDDGNIAMYVPAL